MTREEAMHGTDAHRHTALGQPRLDLGQGDVALLGEQLFEPGNFLQISSNSP